MGVPGEKPVRARPRQIQSTYDTESRNRTWATLMEGECSHHCAIPAAPIVMMMMMMIVITVLLFYRNSADGWRSGHK